MTKLHHIISRVQKRSHDNETKKLLVDEKARKYLVDDLSGASIPGSRINNILKQLEAGSPLSQFTLDYLSKSGFLALLRYAKNEISFKDFQKLGKPEQAKRQKLTEARIKKESVERQQKQEALLAKAKRERERIAAERRAYENNPKTIAKRKQNELRQRYDLSFFIEREHFSRLMDILRRVDKGGA